MRIKFCIVVFLMLFGVTHTFQLFAQKDKKATAVFGVTENKTAASPEVASLGTFGIIPANPFTGQANVNIPLYEIKYKDLSVPINLSYTTSGNKVDEHPGWVGLGWSMQAGGTIYRKVNSLYDEHKQFQDNNIPTSYIEACGRIRNTYKNIDSLLGYALVNSGDNQQYAYDAAPDEFVFNFNGYSGVFYLTRRDPSTELIVQVRSNGDYRLKAEVLSIKDNLDLIDYLQSSKSYEIRSIDRSIYGFKITDEKGNQYIFGNTPESLEMSDNGASPSTTIVSAWHLTKIISPAGYEINLNYKRVGRTYTQHLGRQMTHYSYDWSLSNKTSDSYEELTSITILNPVFLTSIVTPAQTVNFSSSRNKELDYPINKSTTPWIRMHDNYMGTTLEDQRDSSYWQKLNNIDVVGVKKFKFNYKEDTAYRMHLTSLEVQTKYDRTIQEYSFDYDTLRLPRYNSRMADHWGYYNGKAYKYDTNYISTRRPNPVFLQAEMLKKVTYPTGGKTELIYEPHTYSKVTNQWPFLVNSQGQDSIAGGLRIKKIISTPDGNSPPVTKEYFYTTDYIHNSNGLSSGVLSGVPTYVDSGMVKSDMILDPINWSNNYPGTVLNFSTVVDNNYLPLSNTNGNFLTYSEVTEKSAGGYTVYKYTNHDNGYTDSYPYVMLTNFASKYHEEAFIGMEAYRGLLLEQSIYNGNKQILKKSRYEYEIDTTDEYWQVPFMYRLYNNEMDVPIVRVSTGAYFLRPALLKKLTETNYKPGDTSSYLSRTTTNKYFPSLGLSLSDNFDNYKVAESVTTASNGDEQKTVFKYPYTKIAAKEDGNGIYSNMAAELNMNALPVGQLLYNNGNLLRRDELSYYNPYDNLYIPQYVYSQVGTSPQEQDLVYNSYDGVGNIQEVTKRGGEKIAYIWDYNYQYPVAVVKNASIADIAYTSFETNNNGGWIITTSISDNSTTPGGSKAAALGGTSNLIKTGLTVSKKYIVSYWSTNGSQIVSGSTNVLSGKVINGWTYYQHTVTNVTSVSIQGSGNIDEIRLYPADAEMNTFIFEPLIGMKSQCDSRGIFTYYEYDSFARLHLVRNQDKHILKMYCYNYYGQIEKCNENIYYNTTQSDTFYATCGIGQYGSAVEYTIDAGTYGSDISIDSANSKARAALYANGSAYATEKGYCYFKNKADSSIKYKVCGIGYISSPVKYKVDEGTYISTVSQAQADSLASVDIAANAQNYATTNGTCTACNFSFSKKPDSNTLPVFNLTVTNVSTGAVVHNKNYVDEAFIDTCMVFPSGTTYTAVFTVMDTDDSLFVTIGGSEKRVSYSTPQSWSFSGNTSTTAYLSTYPVKVYSNGAESASYQKTNCGGDSTGSWVTFTMPANIFSSTSAAEVAAAVETYLNTYGPVYANANGICYPKGKNAVIRTKPGGTEVGDGIHYTFTYGGTSTIVRGEIVTLPYYLALTDGITYTIKVEAQSSTTGFYVSVNGVQKTVTIDSPQTWTASTLVDIMSWAK